jgi:methanogenic corrinoid protein MtbC1
VTPVESLYREYVEALTAGDRRTCSRILCDQLCGSAHLKSVYVDFIQSSLYEVGQRWERNQLSVATEHLASSITEQLLNEVFAAMVPAAPVGRSVIVAAFAPEQHRIGARIVADVFELRGWDSHFVAGDTMSGQLREALTFRKPDLVAVSLTNTSLLPIFEQKLAELRRACPHLEVLIGGQALRHVGASLAAPDPLVTHLASLEALERFLADKTAAAPPVPREAPRA